MPAAGKLCVALAMVAVCGWGGYAYGRRDDGAAAAKDSKPAKASAQPERAVGRSQERTGDPMAEFELLLEGSGSDPDLWKVVRRMKPEQIPGALEKLKASPQRKLLGSLEKALYHRWAQSEPEAALAAALKESEPGLHNEKADSVICAWMKYAPEAAFLATKGNNIQWTAGEMMTRTWTPENLFSKLKQFPENEQMLFGKFCVNAALNPEAREKMLALFKAGGEGLTAKSRDWGYGQLFRRWVQEEPEGALAELPNHEVPWLKKQVIEDGLNSQPSFTLPWAVENGIAPGGPTWEGGYASWLRVDTKEARAWLEGQAEAWNGEKRQGVATALLAEDFKMVQRTKGTDPKPAEALAKQWSLWHAADPGAAERWRADAGPEVNAVLPTPAGP